MAQSVSPQYSKSRVSRAGRNARLGAATPEDLSVIENWRASHAHILNSFQTTLRNKRTSNSQIVQRLKRLNTIVDKLKRRPNFSLIEMQDIAGCRVILPSVDELNEFREKFLASRIGHERITSDDRYNYIARPKSDGYRGVHDVFRYRSRKKAGDAWRGLRVEIQYRTNVQHAWATAVEVAGFLTENDPKFGRGSEKYLEFFRCASEVLARRHEGMAGPLARTNFSDIERRIREIAQETNIINIFEEFNKLESNVPVSVGQNVYIFIKSVQPEGSRTDVKTFDRLSDALRELSKFERASVFDDRYDMVVVRNVSGGFVNNAYRNYFDDTREFLRLLREAVAIE